MRPIVPLFILLSVMWIFGGSWWMSSTACGANSAIAPLTIQDTDLNFNASANQHFSFLMSSSKVGIEPEAKTVLGQVAQHLIDHPERAVNLDGLYLADEKNISEFENLGIARAEELKLVLIEAGVVADRITTNGSLEDELNVINEKIIDGVSFSFFDLNTSSELIDATPEMEEAPVEDFDDMVAPLTLGGIDYDLTLTPSMQHHIDMFLAYLDQHPGSTIAVVGHTIDKGNDDDNKLTALSRADRVRRFFRENGVRSKQITAYSAGATEPLVEVDDPEATTKNNRVVVQIKPAE